MTSAISLRKYVKQQVRERSWLLILISVVSFLAIPVFLLMSMQNVADRYAHKPAGYEELMLIARKTEALHILDHSNAFLCICVVIAACLTAFSCFIWLYNKEKTDFYFGTAMTRKTQFHAAVLTGLIVAVVPYVVMTLIALLVICPLYGVLTAALVSAALSMMVWCILGYLAVTFVVTVALLLCGRSLPGVLMTAFFLGFGPCVVSFFLLLITGHLETYFTSFIERVQLQWYLSPVTLLFIPGIAGKTHYPVLIGVMAAYVVCGYLLSWFLYVRRPAETAGAPLTYPAMMPFVKAIVTIPCAVVAGTAVGEFASVNNQTAWRLFGGFLAAVMIGGAIEFIAHSDIKAAMRHWKSGLAAVAGTALIILGIGCDPFGYDRFLPEEDEIRAMAMSEDFYLEAYGDYYRPDAYYRGDDKPYSEIDMLKLNLTEDFGPIYRLAEEGVSYVENNSRPFNNSVMKEDSMPYENLVVLYELKSGKQVYRSYTVPVTDIEEAVRELSSQKAIREVNNPFKELDPAAFNTIYVQQFDLADSSTMSTALSMNQRQELSEALKADTAGKGAAELKDEQPLATLDFAWDNPGDEYSEWSVREPFGKLANLHCIYVYPSYERTLAFLKDNGMTFDPDGMAEQVEEIRLDVQIGNDDDLSGCYFRTYRITEPESIQRLLKAVQRVRFRTYGVEPEYNMGYRLSTGASNGYTIRVVSQADFDDILKNHAELIDGSVDDLMTYGG